MANVDGSDNISSVSCAQVLQLIAAAAPASSALLIDIRSPRRFQADHIAGSHSIPAGLLLSGEPPDGDLILISERPEQAHAVIDALHADGYSRCIRYLGEGLAGWRQRGLPLRSSSGHGAWPIGTSLLPAFAGTWLILAAAAISSLPLLALGVLLCWESWFEPLQGIRQRRQRLRLDG